VRDVTLAVYERGRELAESVGILLADTKVELGRDATGGLILADEVLTPDSSRFWPADTWRPGGAQPSYDKQYVRDWLSEESGWDRTAGTPPPPLPDHVVERTRAKYVEAYERLTGRDFAAYLASA
jgi:phosphoribosylaminoimidazole-succinocarboxamide synthase